MICSHTVFLLYKITFSSYLTIVSLIKTVHKYLCCCLKLFLHLFPNQTCVRVSCSPLQIICPSTNPHLEHYNGTVYIVKNIKLLINSHHFSVKYWFNISFHLNHRKLFSSQKCFQKVHCACSLFPSPPWPAKNVEGKPSQTL